MPTKEQLQKAQRRVQAREAKIEKMPTIHISRVHVNRQGYTSTGRYVGVGGPLFCALNSANNEELEFRAQDRPQAMGIVKMMFAAPQHASVTDRLTSGQVKKFVGR